MKIATFESKCSCGHQFDLPILSDMSYGEFLYFDFNGDGIKYFCGLNNTTWEFVSRIVDQKAITTSPRKGIIIQQIIGFIADKTHLDSEYIQDRICPICKSIVSQININKRNGFLEIEELSFNQFENQNDFQKEQMVSELIKKLDN